MTVAPARYIFAERDAKSSPEASISSFRIETLSTSIPGGIFFSFAASPA